MEIIKTDKDYSDLSQFVIDFDPEIITYTKFRPEEYAAVKSEWQEQGFGDRVALIDEVNLTNDTYWVELKNKNDETKGLRAIIDINQKKSLLLIGSLLI